MTRDDPAAFAAPPAFGPFRVLHQIGIGALGPVFRTYEPTRDRLVAVKAFRLDVTPEQAQSLADELAKAADAGLFHPSIVEPIAAGVEGTAAYRAEEYVAAESLDVAMRHYAPAPLDRALPFLTQLAGAIDFARAAGVGHGGLHLRDVFVTPDEARASGFGIVEALERVGVRAPVRRPYSAPERIAGGEWGTPADVFSLAAIAYELLTGRRPSGTGDQLGELSGANIGSYAPAIRSVLARAMAEQPGRRYSTALGFASALETAARTGAAESTLAAVVPAIPDAASEPKVEPAPTKLETPITTAPAPLTPSPVAPLPVVEPLPVPTAKARPVAAEKEPSHDDEPAPTFFDDAEEEAAVPLRMDDHAVAADHSERWKIEHEPTENVAPIIAADRIRSSGREERAFAPAMSHEVLTTIERPRVAMLPIAVTAVICLLVGYMIRGAVSESGAPPATEAAKTNPPATAAEPPAPQTPAQAPGRAYSDQSVTPPAGAASAPRGEAPPVPGDVPSSPAPTATTATGSNAAARAARLTVLSTPSRAGVTVNGKWRGRTPLTLDTLPLGAYNVRVVQPGFVSSNEDLVLTSRQPMRTVSVRLQPVSAKATPPAAPAPSARPTTTTTHTPAVREVAPQSYAGTIYVDSRPRGATVLIDGKPMGTTPASIPGIPIGSHVIRLELADHRAWTTSTSVAAGEQARVTGSLEPIR